MFYPYRSLIAPPHVALATFSKQDRWQSRAGIPIKTVNVCLAAGLLFYNNRIFGVYESSYFRSIITEPYVRVASPFVDRRRSLHAAAATVVLSNSRQEIRAARDVISS